MSCCACVWLDLATPLYMKGYQNIGGPDLFRSHPTRRVSRRFTLERVPRYIRHAKTSKRAWFCICFGLVSWAISGLRVGPEHLSRLSCAVSVISSLLALITRAEDRITTNALTHLDIR